MTPIQKLPVGSSRGILNDRSLIKFAHVCCGVAAVIPYLISSLSAQNAPDDPLELKGTQTERIVTLKKARAPHTIIADYVVPEGCELNIEEGAHLTFSKNSGLSVQGKLNIGGTPQAVVVFAGRGTGSASWNGININRSSSATIRNTRITGANAAINIYASNPLLESVHMHGNTVGIRIGEGGGRSDPTVRNCLITHNKGDGIQIFASTGTFENCTIDRNGGWGIRGEYYASPKLSSCRITRNKQGGIWCQHYDCRVEAHNSMIIDNGRYDLVNDSPENWDFSGNWWGATATAVLKKKGDTANLAAIKDGRDRGQAGPGQVSLASFLVDEPKAIGSTIISSPSAQNALDEPLELKGTQMEPIVTLKKARLPHTIIGDYVVPEGCELNIEEGTHLTFSKDSGLSVQGKLHIDGTPQADVVFEGRGTGYAFWNGININRSSSATISNTRITGANVAINIIGSNPLLEDVYTHGNTVGIRIGEGSDPTVRNCLITHNRGDGVQIFASTGTFVNCTIDSNGRRGIRGELHASPKLSSCRITRNKYGGVWCKLAGSSVEAHNSMIIDNGRYDLVNDSPENWDLSGNWWGAATTAVLKEKGDTANLDTIKDGRDWGQTGTGQVSLDSFLEDEPKAIGSTIISSLSVQSALDGPLDAPLELKGTQMDRIVTLKKARVPHTIIGDYVVPEGYELIIEEGTHIAFSKNSGLSVQGKLHIDGTPEAVVVCAGRGAGSASWNGININSSSSTTISNIRITGANVAINIAGANPLLQGVYMHGNTVGIQIGEGSDPTVRNCLITHNRGDGMQIFGSTGTFINCTIDSNGRWGIRGELHASPKLSSCRITRNRQGGIWFQLAGCSVEAHNSMIIDNGRYDLVNDSPESWDFSENWWGAAATAVLKKEGDTANLLAIKDGRDRGQAGIGHVSLASFLDAEPVAIGSTIKPK